MKNIKLKKRNKAPPLNRDAQTQSYIYIKNILRSTGNYQLS